MQIQRLCVLVVAVVAGCSAGLRTVPIDQWQTVPTQKREAIDRANLAALTAAQNELRAATAAAAEAPRGASAPRRTTAIATSGDGWGKAVHEHERQKTEAIAEIERARIASLQAAAAWRVQRLAAAKARFEVVACEREVERAKAIDHEMLGTDTYEDLPMFRGQLADAQGRWYALSTAAEQAHGAVAEASVRMATAKNAYASLVRSGPRMPDDPAQLRVAGWLVPKTQDRSRGIRPVVSQPGLVAVARYR